MEKLSCLRQNNIHKCQNTIHGKTFTVEAKTAKVLSLYYTVHVIHVSVANGYIANLHVQSQP